jgi:multidrug resistance efflux pump
MSGIFTKFVLPLAAVVAIVFAVGHVTTAQKPESQRPPVGAPTQNPFAATVAGAGLIEAATENIAAGTPVAGVVVEVFVKVEDRVTVGTPLFRLDDRMLRADLEVRKAAVAAAQADVSKLEHMPRPENLRMMQAQLDEARANMLDQKDQYERTRVLMERKATTDQELKTREQVFHACKAKFDRAQTEFEMTKSGAWKYELDVCRAALAQAVAQQQQIETELKRLVVRSLVDGVVLQVELRPGEFVAAPASKTLVLIGDVDQLHVRVDVDEHDIPRFVPGAAAKGMLRGQSQHEFALRFVRVEPYVIPKKSLTGDNTERVDTRVLPVIYALDRNAIQSAGHRLYVGQQLDVYIDAGGDPKPALAEK